ncbi:MAG: dihydrolipoyllysine-residue acetyltransferase [Gammaproteobacteria bacterium]|nr:dihydrolipoyllysine-residue acetyltransferase [Rhodocyclaceae bacterium]MBU3909707.1 dihydrolipoyllysine-residue acetyltransferase [Gammaproteobacteria bacterium]MBU3989281.1 dihydrolipoyllysine-residue acetyltransferase [Gammaproteobacteria bacterium]MBU4005240.1 dihydrolipoyllysine-residue acetyltransferase [Gammaproteobacteria bacterium]MBU4022419.1 dihydrolipoyllysine-residue acetyltransferase [Gammaproteobacteria bacterium]
MMEVKVPDIGDFNDVPVIEVHVKPGDVIKAEDTLITLESDKATMDVPAPAAGTVREVKVKVGDKVARGTLVLLLDAAAGAPAATPEPATAPAPAKAPAAAAAAVLPAPTFVAPAAEGEVCDLRPTEAEPTTAPQRITMPTPGATATEIQGGKDRIRAHASPSVRRFSRELGVDILKVSGSGPKGRITQQDVQNFIKNVMSGAAAPSAPAATGGAGLNLLPWPQVDFAKFGPVEVKPLLRIKKISGPNLARNWVMIPAVTYHEDADITDLEALRVQLNKENEKAGIKVTMLAFMIKAAVAMLKKYPELNSSLDGDNLVYKNYWHIGFAADTPHGLMVPVLKNADQKGVFEIAQETSDLAKKARDGKLPLADMQGATFTISSVGGIGGTAFSPIVNAPEVGILGVSKSSMKPVWDGKQFVPRLIVPLSLSADHRVVDGALATRCNAYLAQLLGDFRRVNL